MSTAAVEKKLAYVRVTVPRFREMLKETGIDLAHGTYFEIAGPVPTADDKPYENCFACAVGTVAAYCSRENPETLEMEGFDVDVVSKWVPTLPVNYLAGLEQGFEGFMAENGEAYDGLASEWGHVNGKWKPLIDLDSEDYKLGKQDGTRIRRAHDNGTL